MVGHDDQMIHSESTLARMKRDTEDENKIVSCLERLKVFAPDTSCDVLQNIATEDLSTIDISKNLF